jgi:hypothetical protein
LIYPPELSGKYQQRHLVANQEELGEKWQCILQKKYLFHTSKGSLTSGKICRHGADGTLRIVIAFKNPSLSPGFEPANLGSNCKHANHYITKDDFFYTLYFDEQISFADT